MRYNSIQFSSSTAFKMKVLALFLVSVALASATIFGKKNIDIKEDGTIVIKGDDGKQITISKQFGIFGPKNIEIEVTGPNTIGKKIQISDNNQVTIEKGIEYQIPVDYEFSEDERYKRASVAADKEDVYTTIFKEFQGVIDAASYQKLLTKVQKAVTKGKMTSDVLDYLQALNEESNWKKMTEQSTFGQGINTVATPINKPQITKGIDTVYGQGMNTIAGQGMSNIYGQTQMSPLLTFWQQKYAQEYYGTQQKLLSNILVQILNKQALAAIVNQQGIYGQGFENIDSIIYSQGIFNKAALVELINNPSIRTILVQQGLFNEATLKQLFVTFNAQGVYNDVLLEQLVNKQVLKYLLVNQGVLNNYLAGHVVAKRSIGKYTFGQGFLLKCINNPLLRNMLIQQGILNKDVAQQVLVSMIQGGFINPTLFDQLINKEVLRNTLVQQGIVDENVLDLYVNNEVLGLKTLMRSQFVLQSPRLNYKQWVGVVSNVPEYTQDLPYGEEISGLYQQTPYQYTNDVSKVGNVNYLRNVIYGQQGTGLNRETNQGLWSQGSYPQYQTYQQDQQGVYPQYQPYQQVY